MTMVRRTRAEMEQTRATLLATARAFFSARGYADTSMDDLTAQAGLTRGALYHHFGDKQGLLAAVVEQIDAEMDERLNAISDAAADPWEGFRLRCTGYLEMALEPTIQRVVLRDARAVLGGASPESQRHCIDSMQRLLTHLIDQGMVAEANPQALASWCTAAWPRPRSGSPMAMMAMRGWHRAWRRSTCCCVGCGSPHRTDRSSGRAAIGSSP